MSKSPQDVLSQIKDEGIELIDLKFTDIHGKWQHLTLTSDIKEIYASSKWPIGFNDSAFNTSGCAFEGPGPNKSLEGT